MNRSSRRVGVIVDRQPLWLDALENLLARLDVGVVARSTELVDVFELVREHEADLLVLGLESGDAGSELLTGVRQVTSSDPRTRVVIVCSDRKTRTIEAAFAAGAHAYCVKSATPEDLTAAIRQAFEPSIYLPINADGDDGRSLPSLSGADVELTRRETEILRLASEGHSNARLAAMLWVTEQTVKFHLSNIYRKLGVSNRTEASRWAQLHGLLAAEGKAAAEDARALYASSGEDAGIPE
jgi:DNA-binding NarL/FixJ family response regulator